MHKSKILYEMYSYKCITLIIVINCSKYTLEYNQRLTKILDFSQIYTWVCNHTWILILDLFLYSLINCEQFRTEKPARKAFFIRIVRICIVGQSDAIMGERVLIWDYRLTYITFETPLTHPDVQTSIKNFRSQKIKNFRDRPFNGRFFLWAFHFIFSLRELLFG